MSRLEVRGEHVGMKTALFKAAKNTLVATALCVSPFSPFAKIENTALPDASIRIADMGKAIGNQPGRGNKLDYGGSNRFSRRRSGR